MSPSRPSTISRRVLARADRLSVAAAATAALGTLASAHGALVTWNCNLVIPDTFAGMYIDVAAQTYSTDASAVSAWDINPYSTATPGSLAFSGNYTVYVVVAPANDTVRSLAAGTVVGPASNFGNSAGNVFDPANSSGWQLNATSYFGFTFDGEAAGTVLYGYGVMQVGATGDIRTLQTLVYENSGASITIPGAVPAPGAIALLSMAGLARSRRRRFG